MTLLFSINMQTRIIYHPLANIPQFRLLGSNSLFVTSFRSSIRLLPPDVFDDAILIQYRIDWNNTHNTNTLVDIFKHL